MKKSVETTVREWLMVMKIACDEDSPFCGQVDLTKIFSLPIETQRAIHDALTPLQRERLKEVYGPKEPPQEGGAE
jgi:hypothetical protein